MPDETAETPSTAPIKDVKSDPPLPVPGAKPATPPEPPVYMSEDRMGDFMDWKPKKT